MNTKFVNFSKKEVSKEMLEKCADLYCEVWKEPPWNEDFWKPEEVLLDIQKEIAKPFAELLIAQDEKEICLGFTWGYQVLKDDMRFISTSCDLDYLFEKRAGIWYIDELAVEYDWRKKGIGIKLTERLISQFKASGAEAVTLRTDEKAVAARGLYQKIGFQEMSVKDGKYSTRTYWILTL